jgi:hypothetical protein
MIGVDRAFSKDLIIFGHYSLTAPPNRSLCCRTKIERPSMSAKTRSSIALLIFLMLSQPQMAAATEWPPADPNDYTTQTDFTIAWAKRLAGFRTLEDLQRAQVLRVQSRKEN